MNTRLPLKGGQNSSGVQGKRYCCAAVDLEENQTDLSVVLVGQGGEASKEPIMHATFYCIV